MRHVFPAAAICTLLATTALVVSPRPVDAQDGGDLQVMYEPIENPAHEGLPEMLQGIGLLEEMGAALNESFAWPVDVPVVVAECGEVNAYYDPSDPSIVICYELVEHFGSMFLAGAEDEQAFEDGMVAVVGATTFIFFHEVGHGLIHLHDLPVTGREEDAVDQLATILLLAVGDDGITAAINGASSFVLDGGSGDDMAFWDEHSLSEQRFYNILCWVFGHDPDATVGLVHDGTLPEERAAGCPEEYERMYSAWERILDPFVLE